MTRMELMKMMLDSRPEDVGASFCYVFKNMPLGCKGCPGRKQCTNGSNGMLNFLNEESEIVGRTERI